jgi:hypothetical protein
VAVIPFSNEKVKGVVNYVNMIQWASVANNDTGELCEIPGAADRSVQVQGTFGGATVIIQGSNDGTNWHTLNHPQGSPLSFAAAGLKGVVEITRFIRPSVSGGDGTTSVTVTLLARRVAA